MPKKKAMNKAAKARPIILANNPRNDNSCQCFVRNVPSNDWIIISRFPNMTQCQNILQQCSTFFMGMPLSKAHMAMKAHKKMG